MRMNGMPVGEVEINAAIAGYFGVPVIMVSGDDCLGKEATTKSLGEVERPPLLRSPLTAGQPAACH